VKTIGYVVIEGCEDYEQILALNMANTLPPGGLLEWPTKRLKSCVFPTRKDARAAIERTHHYAKAYGLTDLPERQYCIVKPVVTPHPTEAE